MSEIRDLHVATPLLESTPMSRALGVPVFLKMEALQPAGSFKIRGIGRLCRQAVDAGARRLVSSSGGNAGYAVAYAGRRLGVAVDVVVPKTTPEWMRRRIEAEGAVVLERGSAWDEAHEHALELAASSAGAYVHPFDHPAIWDGHATMIEEAARETPKPGAVVLAVGGGGLLCGVLTGLHRVGWGGVPVLAVETEGAASFAASVKVGRLVTLDKIATIATSLGARTVAAETLKWASRHPVTPWTVSDRAAAVACARFADDHRVLVEPACGAALSAVFDQAAPLKGKASLLVIVCGGAGVTVEKLGEWLRATSTARA